LIIAGNCLLSKNDEVEGVLETAKALQGLITHFRCKIIGGGTIKYKYRNGIGFQKGLKVLETINKFIPTGTEVQTLSHIEYCQRLSYVWVGARNCQNYALLEYLEYFQGDVFTKRGVGMTINELVGIYEVMKAIHKKPVCIIERGIININDKDITRWSISLNDILYFKYYYSEIFNKLIIDCSHSAGRAEYVEEIYKSTKAIGCQHFMFECTLDGKSNTDQNHMLSVDKLKEILDGNSTERLSNM